MQVIESVNQIQETSVKLRTQGRLIGLVVTSGALHSGHVSLIKAAQELADTVIVSIFVNPKEFGPNEDFQKYPRRRESDLSICEESGVDIVFIPSTKEMYPQGFSSSVTERKRALGLCGISRPHYFGGACTVYVKLFNLCRPDFLIMGRRDAQLVSVIRNMVEDLNFPVEISVCEVVREPDGLVMNARNQYLNEFQRRDATTIHKALQEGKKLVDSGIINVDRVLAEVTHHISQHRRLRVIYVGAVDVDSMEPLRQIVAGRTLITTAVWCDEIRLLDNILL